MKYIKKSTGLFKNLDYYRSIFNEANDAIYVHDIETGDILDVNQAALKMFGYAIEEASSIKLVDGVANQPGYTPQDVLHIIEKASQGEPQLFEWLAKHKSGRLFWVEVNLKRANIGGQACLIAIVRDITWRKEMEEQLRYLSLHDSLTGLYNRAKFEQKIQQVEDKCYVPMGIVICDLDGLKLVNDSIGHKKGDELLKLAANVIKKCLKKDYIAARIGGDEFAVLLPNGTKEEVENFVQDLRKSIQNYNNNNIVQHLNISIGYAVRNDLQHTLSDVFKEADDCMYREKLHHSLTARSSIVQTFMKSLEVKGCNTESNTKRLQLLIKNLALSIGFSEHKFAELNLLAKFHNIGKIAISDKILFKKGLLTEKEFTEVQKHCEIGFRVARSSPDLIPIADLILKHHEWWNGKGYPLGLKEKEIPLECRIFAIVDAYNAMTSDRPYRKAMDHNEAMRELIKYSGVQFDPELIKKFISTF